MGARCEAAQGYFEWSKICLTSRQCEFKSHLPCWQLFLWPPRKSLIPAVLRDWRGFAFQGEVRKMAFNTKDTRASRAVGSAPTKVSTVASGFTGNRHVGYAADARTELFLAGVSSFFGQDAFYEKGDAQAERFVKLVRQVAVEDAVWLLSYVTWLRRDGNIRSAAVVAGLEGAKALLDSGHKTEPGVNIGMPRLLASAGILRADEPGEALAYWASRYGNVKKTKAGRLSAPKLPKPIKRGLADACLRVINERNVAKFDTDSKGFRFADVLNLCHVDPKVKWRDDLFGWLVASRYGKVEIPDTLNLLRTRAYLLSLPVESRRAQLDHPEALKQAGMTWEALSGWLQGPMDAQAWEAIIPSMGYMALIRNLRNFDQAGVSDKVAYQVAAKIADPDEVKRSKQFPFRIQSAFSTAPSLRWGHPLSKALDLSLGNVPQLSGRTLVLVDTSGSMDVPFSKDGKVKRWDAAALFGIALAHRSAGVDLWSYSGGGAWSTQDRLQLKKFDVTKGSEILAECGRWISGGYNFGGGTPTAAALRKLYDRHDRVIVLTDEQADQDMHGTVDQAILAEVPMYTFNLAGYKMHATPGTRTRHHFGGLTDQAFTLIPMIEAGIEGGWPWEQSS